MSFQLWQVVGSGGLCSHVPCRSRCTARFGKRQPGEEAVGTGTHKQLLWHVLSALPFCCIHVIIMLVTVMIDSAAFQLELDTRHDKYERLVKLSRDITIESKRTIFLLHRFTR